MSNRTEIVDWAVAQFTVLADLGFSRPLVRDDTSMTSIDWLGTTFALELELDWREFEAFFLIVKLENGDLPDGYYMSKGSPCRYHIERVIRERRWPVAQSMLSTRDRREARKMQPSAAQLKQMISGYKVLVISCMEQLNMEAVEIFKDAK